MPKHSRTPFAEDKLARLLRADVPRQATAPVLQLGSLTLDIKHRRGQRGRKRIALSAVEWNLLSVLLRHQGDVVSRDQLQQDVWGLPPHIRSSVVDNTVDKLRRKIEPDAAAPAFLLDGDNGYCFRTTPVPLPTATAA